MAFGRKFSSQKAAENYYGHTWSWILNHKKVIVSIGWKNGQQCKNGYFIENK